jgi:hypothetical protein
MDKVHLKITMTRVWLPPSPEGPNVTLMSYFVSQGHSSKNLQSINRCRVYLQVLFLSDLVSADARSLIWPALQGVKLID